MLWDVTETAAAMAWMWSTIPLQRVHGKIPSGFRWHRSHPYVFTPWAGCLSTLNVRLDTLDRGIAPISPSHHLFEHVAGGDGNIKQPKVS